MTLNPLKVALQGYVTMRIDCTRAALHFSEPCSSSPASGTHIMFCMDRCAGMTDILDIRGSDSCIGPKARPGAGQGAFARFGCSGKWVGYAIYTIER